MTSRQSSTWTEFARSGQKLGARVCSIVIAVTACLTGLLSIWQLDSQREWEAAAGIERLGGSVVWAWRLDMRVQEKRYPCYQAPSWLVPGDAFVEGIHLTNCRAPQLDQKLACLNAFDGLRTLALGNAAITDATLQHIAGLSRLEWLDVHDTPITDQGLRRLSSVERLEWLNLCNTRISDASVPFLVSLKRLKRINLGGTQFTAGGLAFLREQLPTVQIRTDSDSNS